MPLEQDQEGDRCRYSALCIAYGPNGRPFTMGIEELFVLRIEVLVPLLSHSDNLDLEDVFVFF